MEIHLIKTSFIILYSFRSYNRSNKSLIINIFIHIYLLVWQLGRCPDIGFKGVQSRQQNKKV